MLEQTFLDIYFVCTHWGHPRTITTLRWIFCCMKCLLLFEEIFSTRSIYSTHEAIPLKEDFSYTSQGISPFNLLLYLLWGVSWPTRRDLQWSSKHVFSYWALRGDVYYVLFGMNPYHAPRSRSSVITMILEAYVFLLRSMRRMLILVCTLKWILIYYAQRNRCLSLTLYEAAVY